MASFVDQMGIAATSFGGAVYGQGVSQNDAVRKAALATIPVIPGAPNTPHADTLEFLERCHALGARGIQAQMNGDFRRVRARAEELGMWMEAMVSICQSTPEQLEQAILDAKAAGCTVARDALLSGRRYQTFSRLSEWNQWRKESYSTVERVLPLLERHRFTLALENHKDWTADEYFALFRKFSSEYLGACVDFGNNLSLLDDPMEFVEAAAPYARSTHVKDMALLATPEGFEMVEVPLGDGVLDVPRMAAVLLRANPGIRFSLEMITRDPLTVPCLSDSYWETLPDRNGRYLARTLRLAQQCKAPLPRVDHLGADARRALEEENIRTCLSYKANGA